MTEVPKDAAGYDYLTATGLDRRRINGALHPARNSTMLTLLGDPRGTYDAECRALTNPHLADQMAERDLGRFTATGLSAAVDVLTEVMATLRLVSPEVHRSIGLSAMLCCRRVAVSGIAISNHSWGIAVDLTVAGEVDPWNAPETWEALHLLHGIFAQHGFFWGAAFHAEEPMHFEASDQLIRTWAAEGRFGSCPHRVPEGLSLGDRGTEVEALQHRLNAVLAPAFIDVDGIFGTDTRAATIECQRRRGLPPDGLAHTELFLALGLG